MRSANRPLWHVCAILFLLLVLGSVQSWAQLDTGSIVGTIHDKSGAVVFRRHRKDHQHEDRPYLGSKIRFRW